MPYDKDRRRKGYTPLQKWIKDQKSAGATFPVLAQRLGVHAVTVKYYSSGRNRPHKGHLERLAKVTGLTLIDLLR
jgi:transcriptional regulator with XRE-family HTH domain